MRSIRIRHALYWHGGPLPGQQINSASSSSWSMEGSFFPSQVTDDRIRVLQQRNGVEETPASGVDVLPKSAIEGYVRRTRSPANFDLRPGPGNLPALVRMGPGPECSPGGGGGGQQNITLDDGRTSRECDVCAQDPSLFLTRACPDLRNVVAWRRRL